MSTENVPEPKKKPNEDSSELKKDSYFWNDQQSIKFIRYIREHGKKWKKISTEMPEKSAMQCRSHGQKYLQNLTNLKTLIETNRNTDFNQIKNSDLIKLLKYEDDCNQLLAAFESSSN